MIVLGYEYYVDIFSDVVTLLDCLGGGVNSMHLWPFLQVKVPNGIYFHIFLFGVGGC